MSNGVVLKDAVRIVRAELAVANDAIGAFPMHGTSEDRARWQTKRREVMTALEHRLADQVLARINQQWSGSRVRIAGISASSTSGFSGALTNWLRAAEKRVA